MLDHLVLLIQPTVPLRRTPLLAKYREMWCIIIARGFARENNSRIPHSGIHVFFNDVFLTLVAFNLTNYTFRSFIVEIIFNEQNV